MDDLKVLKSRLKSLEKEFKNHWKSHRREHKLEHGAIKTARKAMNARLASMNELRAQLTEAESKFATRAEVAVIQKLVWMALGMFTIVTMAVGWFLKH